MSKGTSLKGVAYGLLGTFVSRNNDIDGYWGLATFVKTVRAIMRRSLKGLDLFLLYLNLPYVEQSLKSFHSPFISLTTTTG